jgi:hypothetical protein
MERASNGSTLAVGHHRWHHSRLCAQSHAISCRRGISYGFQPDAQPDAQSDTDLDRPSHGSRRPSGDRHGDPIDYTP